MKTDTAKDILIVGGGLAGVFYAAVSAQAGHRITLFDQHHPRSASRVAAGLFNILTGRYASLTWQAREFLATLDEFFQYPPFAPLQQHIHKMPVYRPYKTAEERQEWENLSQTPEYADLVQHQANPIEPDRINNPLGGLMILPCGWADVPALLTGLQAVLTSEFGMKLVEAPFPYEAFDPEIVDLPGYGCFDEVVFAEGVGILQNPWFNYVEVRPLKGQILEFEADGLGDALVVLRKCFVIPQGGGRFLAGSTYEHRYEDDAPTPDGQALLHTQLSAAVQAPLHVTGMRAGLRPTTPNRRPILGRHPEFPRLHVLNGLGTKGLLQAPWCARKLRDWIDGVEDHLPESVDVRRFFEKKPVI